MLMSLALAAVATLRSEIETMSKKGSKLMMAKNVSGFVALVRSGVSSNFQYVENGKTEAFEVMAEGMKLGIGGMQKITRSASKIVSLKESGTGATCMMQHLMVGTVAGPDKKPHTLSFTGTSKDTYVKEGGKWKMSRMEWVKQTMTMDGKPMPASGGLGDAGQGSPKHN